MKKFTKALAAIMLMTAVIFTVGCNPEDEPNNGGENNGDNEVEVLVTTRTPQDITSSTAVCGAEVTVTEGVALSELGVCWGTSLNPTAEGSHLSTENWNEPYECTITDLEPATEYHVRAYALYGSEYYYGDDKSFTTESQSGGGGGNGSYNGHDYVDLGLPSGTLWATCNVGADTPEGCGNYFAWGETEPKDSYGTDNYKYYNSNGELIKYCVQEGTGVLDNLTTLEPMDDAATANWGDGWCTPSWNQWSELWRYAPHEWTTQNDMQGWRFTGSNGNSIFLPAAGSRWGEEIGYVGGYGFYWSNQLYWTGSIYTNSPVYAYCEPLWWLPKEIGRWYGMTVRPVRSAE